MLGERITRIYTVSYAGIPWASVAAKRLRIVKAFARKSPVVVTSSSTPADPVEFLKAGNMRFVAGRPQSGPYGPHVAQFASDPYPFAVVLGCSDARVPIEAIFDQTPGNLFVLRVAGNFVNADNLASMEFAIDILKARLVLVLGHSGCGAFSAALASVCDGTKQRGHISKIIDALAPSIEAARGFPGDWLENAIAHNVARNVNAIIAGSEIVSRAVDTGDAQVVGGIYNITTGWVAFT